MEFKEVRLFKVQWEENGTWEEVILCLWHEDNYLLKAYDFLDMGPTDGSCDCCGHKEAK